MTLAPFDNAPVLSAGIAMKKAGDGLSNALSIAPAEYREGEHLYVLTEIEVGDIHHKRVLDEGKTFIGWRRVHDFIAGTATIVDADLAGPLIEEQKRLIAESRGEHQLPFDGPEEGGDDADASA